MDLLHLFGNLCDQYAAHPVPKPHRLTRADESLCATQHRGHLAATWCRATPQELRWRSAPPLPHPAPCRQWRDGTLLCREYETALSSGTLSLGAREDSLSRNTRLLGVEPLWQSSCCGADAGHQHRLQLLFRTTAERCVWHCQLSTQYADSLCQQLSDGG